MQSATRVLLATLLFTLFTSAVSAQRITGISRQPHADLGQRARCERSARRRRSADARTRRTLDALLLQKLGVTARDHGFTCLTAQDSLCGFA
jgi:hypothetical protein